MFYSPGSEPAADASEDSCQARAEETDTVLCIRQSGALRPFLRHSVPRPWMTAPFCRLLDHKTSLSRFCAAADRRAEATRST